MQLDHYSNFFKKRLFPITVVCDNVTNAPNIGGLFRTCDAFGIEKLIFCGSEISMGRKMAKTSRATEKSVNYSIASNSLDVVTQLKNEGYFLIALEITSESNSLATFKFIKDTPIALIIGDENFGISETTMAQCDATVHIDMYGQNSSMNVVQATSVTLYEITKQLK
ncbi:MAG: TrmH family RNA methyltransferase [Algicola sp.]|nr:TrmH family RNA methyltransferase [Algicola sp.]